jgi:hypothetical protein
MIQMANNFNSFLFSFFKEHKGKGIKSSWREQKKINDEHFPNHFSFENLSILKSRESNKERYRGRLSRKLIFPSDFSKYPQHRCRFVDFGDKKVPMILLNRFKVFHFISNKSLMLSFRFRKLRQ